MEPPDPKDIVSNTAGDLNRTKADAAHWLKGSEYVKVLYRLEDAHAAVEATLIEARRQVQINGEREQ